MLQPPGSSERPVTVVLQNQVTRVGGFCLSTGGSRYYLEWTQGGAAFLTSSLMVVLLSPLDQKSPNIFDSESLLPKNC